MSFDNLIQQLHRNQEGLFRLSSDDCGIKDDEFSLEGCQKLAEALAHNRVISETMMLTGLKKFDSFLFPNL